MIGGTYLLKAIFTLVPIGLSQMPHLMDVYYMVTHLAGVAGTAKAKLYGMDDDYSIRIQRKAKTASGIYVTTTRCVCW